LRDEANNKILDFGRGQKRATVPRRVWNHFSDLRGIERLGRVMGARVVVVDFPFQESQRGEYVRRVTDLVQRYGRTKIVFLDPDTGIQPDELAGPKHATFTDVQRLWGATKRNDILAVYQHASRRSGWIQKKAKQAGAACGGSQVSAIRSPGISKDVALLWTRKA